ncbi:glycosyltransferase [Stieleria varia]|uniref:Putative glycosyltransferase EpsD n=1 Tax=Stieleria varia TaxID=2528005 RepID=A0A5C6APD5_9BACT|nr:glycosyltransferase [Stieleria varia]TWU01281.1 putative glycosyltransferase EpsD [Stieleria varia]
MSNDLPTICQVLHSLTVGGAEVLAREYAVNAAGKFNTVFACLDEIGTIGNELLDCGYVVEKLDRRSGFDHAVARRLRRFCLDHDVDVIHAHQYTPFFYASLCRFPGRRPPILFTEHGRHFPDTRRPKRVFANRFLLGRRDHITAVGNHVRTALIQNEGFSADRIQVIHNGIDVDAFRSSEADRATVRGELGIMEGQVAVFHVARLNPLKDHATALRAWQRLRDAPHIRLFLVGDGEERQSIEAFIGEHRLHSTVSLLGLRDDVRRLLPAADVFLLSSVSEGIPLTLIEAMATSLPCVSTSVGGIPEVVVNGETGLLSSAGDDISIADHIRTLADDPGMRNRLGDHGRRRAEQMFSNVDMHSRYHHIYSQLCAGQSIRCPR